MPDCVLAYAAPGQGVPLYKTSLSTLQQCYVK